MFRPIRVDHTNCLQVAIKTHSFREWSQNERQSGNYRGRKRCLTGVSFTPHAADLNTSEHTEVKKLRQRNWEQTSVSRWKDSPDPLPDTDVIVYPDREGV